MVHFFTIPDHPNRRARGTVWSSNGFAMRGFHNDHELQTWQRLEAAYGNPNVDIGTMNYADVQHIPVTP